MAQTAVRDTRGVPELLRDLRDHITKITKRPIDPDLDFLTDQIELRSATEPTIISYPSLPFSPKERQIVTHLSARQGQIFSRDALMNLLYFDNPDPPAEKIVDVYILRIRDLLAHRNEDFWIETVYGIGFRMVKKNAREAYRALIARTKNVRRRFLPPT